MLNGVDLLAGPLMLAGIVFFLAGAIPVHWRKLPGGGAVTTCVHWILHREYVGLAILGLGTLLLWPRFLVLVSYVTMLYLYARLAEWEEERCLRGSASATRATNREPVDSCLARGGPGCPRSSLHPGPEARGDLRDLPARGRGQRLAGLRPTPVCALAGDRPLHAGCGCPVTSLADRGGTPHGVSDGDHRPQGRDGAAPRRARNAHHLRGPLEWRCPISPSSATLRPDPSPALWIRSASLQVLFTHARTHMPRASGPEIVLNAYGRDPIVVARVDISGPTVTAIETPPEHVRWGDIPTPMF